jgi:integrase
MVPLWKETSQTIRNWIKFAGLTPDQPLLPNRFGTAMTRTAVQQRLHLYVQSAEKTCPSLRHRRISPHTIRHTTAMHLLQSGVATPVIALWLGHEDPATTHQYIEADLLMKEAALNRLQAPKEKQRRFVPSSELLQFLDNL